jgi:hypothetical protein
VVFFTDFLFLGKSRSKFRFCLLLLILTCRVADSKCLSPDPNFYLSGIRKKLFWIMDLRFKKALDPRFGSDFFIYVIKSFCNSFKICYVNALGIYFFCVFSSVLRILNSF